ncbi:Inter-alpha-trypsin inhibitor heavy chain H3 (ITI heavy chain H3) (ITI-HC3) (Inter-alpha-inhibitor heavy chain 3) [Durusdinium trenchii]|uniref:Inter-alpha-trypsin inhibitor heavy chain H3 (ITI heavy chain H3) (ITI-HC3) (Inter-alpha-inhibitor heavy chain 3) n=1 Tax=Durusdinium trenchii TaxID=1381693 RepID=A0ABP0RCX3_9DINO
MTTPSLKVSAHCAHSKYQFDVETDTTLRVLLEGVASPEAAPKRSALDLVLVLDQSGSMGGEKLQLCKETAIFLSRELTSNDRLGLVTYASQVFEQFPLQWMTADAKETFSAKTKGIRATDCTNLSGGLLKGISMLGAAETAMQVDENLKGDANKAEEVTGQRMRAVLLLTDGHANNGITDPEMLCKVTSEALEKIGGGTHLFTFGYGTQHNDELLEKLAMGSNGRYFFIDKSDEVAGAFADCLGGLCSTVAQNIVLELQPAGGATFQGDAMTAFKNSRAGSDGFRVEIPDLFAEESRSIMIKMSLPKLTAPVEGDEDAPVAKITASFVDCTAAALGTVEQVVGVARPREVSSAEQVASENADVHIQVLRFHAAEDLERAQRLAEQGQLGEGRSVLEVCRDKMKASRFNLGSDDLVSHLCEELDDAHECLSSPSVFASKGNKKMRSRTAQFQTERQYLPSSDSAVYRNVFQKTMRSRWKKKE